MSNGLTAHMHVKSEQPVHNGHIQNGNAQNGHSAVADHNEGGHHVNRSVTPGGHPMEYPYSAWFPDFPSEVTNPAPLGLMSFAATTFTLSFYNTGARGIDTPNVIVGLALAYGGLVQLLAGMWEFAAGNTFGATVFTSFGAFWISFGLIYWPSSGILDAYEGAAASQLGDALGFYLTAWTIVAFIFGIAAIRSSVGLLLIFFWLVITFALLAAHAFTGIAAVGVAGGAFGIILAFNAFYMALAGLLTPDTSFFALPIGPLGPK